MNAPPIEIRLDPQAHAITLVWPNGAAPSIDAGRLRRMCPCAECRRKRLLHQSLTLADAVRIDDIHPMPYGIQIAFSDGHDRGIFPWSYLAELAGQSA
ncbi:DUF971 domain-containing protein [Trinickia diaoshuihuensis]|uniref:DUF971 domain-containing protein n=1 Tax=Trinickia diaoshuihuensis TaxID=2292265 RepID=UPI000E21EEDC|nr:gamma-butyrobetaine hydroxylase-like domain-containing protein [Trinickia diaoshuihuensis]